jgi:2-polyprenyl-3-methyl-5-hydroxy-6-metoxy-1,4-benzoquinol methylase
MITLRRRSSEPEIMDDLECQGPVVEQTLRELDTINRLLGGNVVTLDGIERLLEGKGANKKVTVADIGCGSGDMATRIVSWSRTKRLDLLVTGFDANPNIIRFARENCKSVERVSFEVMNVLSEEYSARRFDIVVATLFMHHFSQRQLVGLVRSIKRQSRIGFVINDIHRHIIAYHAIRILTLLFSRSSMVKYDAPLSVRRAFKRKELEEILQMAGIDDYTIKWKWAFRWQVIVEA